MEIGLNQFSWPASMTLSDVFAGTKQAGYDSIELCYKVDDAGLKQGGSVADALDIASYRNPLLNESTGRDELRRLRELSEQYELPISSIGGIVPFTQLPFNAVDESVAQKSFQAMQHVLELADALDVGLVQIIPGFVDENTDYEANFFRVVERMQRLADSAPEITLGIENVWNYFLYSPLEFRMLLDSIDRPNVGAYLDIGNVRRLGFPEQWIMTLGSRVKCLHLKDYSVANDNINSFTNLLGGDVDFDKVAAALKTIDYAGTAHVEIIPPARSRVSATLAFARTVAGDIFS